MSDQGRQSRLAFFWMVLSGIGFTGMSALGKDLARSGVPQPELVFFRSWVNFALVLAIMGFRREDMRPGRNLRLLVGRGVVGFLGVNCLFYALGKLPLPISSLLHWCSPIFVLIFSRLFLSEALPNGALRGMAVAFVGVLVLLAPDTGDVGGLVSGLSPFDVTIGVLGAAFGGLAYVAVRAASARVTPNLIVLFFTGTSTLLSLPAAAWDGFRLPPGTLPRSLWMGAFAALGQLAMTRAYALAPAAQVSAMSLMNAVFSAVVGWILFGEVLSWSSWLGALLTSAGVLFLTFASSGPRAGVKSPKRWAMLRPWS